MLFFGNSYRGHGPALNTDGKATFITWVKHDVIIMITSYTIYRSRSVFKNAEG